MHNSTANCVRTWTRPDNPSVVRVQFARVAEHQPERKVMSDQAQKANAFRKLHVRGKPVVLMNIWDAGSAKAVATSGASAIATGSWSVAAAHGFADGEQIPLGPGDRKSPADRACRGTTGLDRYGTWLHGDTPEAVGESIRRTIEAGAIGCNRKTALPPAQNCAISPNRPRESAQSRCRRSAEDSVLHQCAQRCFLSAETRTRRSGGQPSRQNAHKPMPMPEPTDSSFQAWSTSA